MIIGTFFISMREREVVTVQPYDDRRTHSSLRAESGSPRSLSLSLPIIANNAKIITAVSEYAEYDCVC